MKFPDYPRSGGNLREDFIQLLNWVKANMLTSVTGGELRTSPTGTTLTIPKPPEPVFRSGRPDRFIVSLSGNDLSVSVGTVFFGDGGKDKRSYYPIEPTLDGVILSENPSWDVTEKPNDVLHKVWVIWSEYNYDARVELLPGDETPEYDTGENGLNIAEVTFSGEEESRTMTKAQLWESDISGWKGGESDGSSGSGGGSSEGSGGGDSSEDSGIVESSLDASSESGSSESGSSAIVCPDIEILEIIPMEINGVMAEDGEALCFPQVDEDPDDDPGYITISVKVRVGVTPPGCYPFIRVYCNGASNWANVTVTSGTSVVSVELTHWAIPSSPYTVQAALRHPLGYSAECLALNDCPYVTKEYTTPPSC